MVVARDDVRQGHLVPTLGLFSTAMLIVGSMIGSGIFRLPSSMMAKVQDPFLLVLVWIVGGLFTICGALTFAELASIFPRAGGQYVFLRETLGRAWAFLYGWSFFWLVQTGIIAGVAVIFAQFTQRLFGYSFGNAWLAPIAVAVVAFLSVVNYYGVKFGGLVQNVFTVTKFAALLALVVFGFVLGEPSHSTFDQAVESERTGGILFVAFVLAMLQGFFALDGWPQAAYVAPEVKDPARTVPRAMILGVLTVVGIYVLATAVYVFLLPVDRILSIFQAEGVISAEAAATFWGENGAKFISAAVMVSTFGTVNAYILTSPRIFYAVAQDGLFWTPFRRLHPRWNTPDKAIIFQGLWAGYIVALSSLAEDAYIVIIEAVVFGIWLFYIPTTIGYFKLRLQRPDLERPYKTHGYPVVPGLFLLAAVTVVGVLLVSNTYSLFTGEDFLGDEAPLPGLAGIWGTLIIATGLLVLLYWKVRARRGEPSPLAAA